LNEGDEITIREGSRGLTYFKNLSDVVEKRTSPAWLNRDVKKMAGAISRLPERAEIDGSLSEQLIVEYYSRR
jgi:small subunit ribosomal protein S4